MSAAESLNIDGVVNAEMTRGARRAEWRDGYDSGLKHGAARYFNSVVMEDIAIELTLLRTLYPALCEELERRGRLLNSVNRIKTQALTRVVELARELDRRAPGWDRS